MHVKDLMCCDVISVKMDDTLAHVKQLFDIHTFHHLLVVEEKVLVGIVSDRDLLKAVNPYVGTLSETARDSACLNKRVHQIMSRRPISLLPNAGLFRAIQVFNQHRLSCIPIVDTKQQPVGTLSWRDVFRFIETNQLEKHLAKKEG